MPYIFGPDTIIIRQAPLVTDPYDNTEYRDWANAVETTVTNCSVQDYPNLADEEKQGNREYAQSLWLVIAPPVTVFETVTHVDRLVYRGVEYQVFGPVRPMFTRLGTLHHYEFTLVGMQESADA